MKLTREKQYLIYQLQEIAPTKEEMLSVLRKMHYEDYKGFVKLFMVDLIMELEQCTPQTYEIIKNSEASLFMD